MMIIFRISIILLFVSNVYGIKFVLSNKLITKIKLNKGYKKGNTLQGITFFDNKWIISQTDNDKQLIFTFLNKKGEFNKRIVLKYPSHGQDLSILWLKNKPFIVTSSKNNHGIALFNIDKKVFLYKDIKLSLGFNTVAVSKDGNYFVVKNYNSIRIYRVIDILSKEEPRYIYSFFLDEIQQKKSQWFQGLAMKDGFIYTVSGNKKLSSKKYLIIYDSYGKVVKKIELLTGKDIAEKEGKKWELEGLSFVNNKLYTTVMSGKDGKNIKRIFKILEIK